MWVVERILRGASADRPAHPSITNISVVERLLCCAALLFGKAVFVHL